MSATVRARQRILLVTPYYPPHDGGVERYVESLAGELRSRTGWSVAVVTTAEEPGRGPVTYAVEKDVGVYRLPYDVRLSNTRVGAAWWWQLREVLRREDPTLVNAHAPVPGLADVAAGLSGRRTFVLTYHTGPMRKERVVADVAVRTYERMVLPRTLRRADAIITGSDWVRSTLPPRFRDRAVTVHPGVDPDRFTPGDPAHDGQVAGGVFVATLARATRDKNLPGALQALARLRATGLEVDLTVVGDGDARPEYERLATSLGLHDHVTFTGSLSGAPLVEVYRRAMFVVLPTLFDSFPTVLAEAMACGRPVVSTRTGGVAELITSGVDGLLVPPGDVPSLTAAIRALVEDPDLRRRLGAAARVRVAGRLSWRHQAAETMAVFERATAGRSHAGT
jgi:glycosyltransferase involved in cell wall biosynthesis